MYDGATPSANAILAHTLYDCEILADKQNQKNIATEMLKFLLNPVTKHTNSFAIWAILYQKICFGINELTIGSFEYLQPINYQYIPFKILKNSSLQNSKNAIQLCKNYTCYQPELDIESLTAKIKELEAQIALT